MKTDNLKALTISGPLEQLDEAIRRFVVDKPFHPEDACERLAAFRKLRHIEETDVYTPCLARVDALIEQLGLTPACAPSGDDTDNANAYSVEEIASYCRSVEDALRATDVVSEESRWARLAEERVIAHLKNVPVPLRDIADNRYVRNCPRRRGRNFSRCRTSARISSRSRSNASTARYFCSLYVSTTAWTRWTRTSPGSALCG